MHELPKNEDGFGLIELLISLTVLSVAILGLISAMTSGYITLNRASMHSTAGAIADSEMEGYRALTYSAISLGSTTKTKTGPDSRTYRIDTSVTSQSITGGRPVKLVSVSVSSSDGSEEYVEIESTFDKCSGTDPSDTAPCSS